jgi:hypothetical protein
MTARDSELALLCRSCGLCCDGSLFGRVDLEPEEVGAARKARLRVVPSATAFEQPCAALSGVDPVPRPKSRARERRCAVYDDRPRACRRFLCRLHERHRVEGGPLEDRLAAVRRVRALLAALAAGGGVMPAHEYRELTTRLEADFARASE